MLKLFKRRPKDELICADDLVGCLGKLPMHREFIKHGVVQPELASLDHWYQSAYHQLHQHYGVETKTLFSQMPLHNYLYLTSKNPKPMLGAIMASSDQSGRIYPFVIFRMATNPLAGELFSAIPIMYSS
ncbi:MAG: type VI secretion system-associated protein TagF, partial [Gammaproteobacteria bacterium]|nr:type VI secretion system-associated protein TagF [Gammaproteobacteria bacterium]